MNASTFDGEPRRAPVAAPHPTHKLKLLLRREFWEHKGGFFWAPIWAGGMTNSYLLKTTPTTYVVSFLKPVGRAWFTVVLDRRTLLPHQLSMTAPAHFMTHAYSRFNAPARIRPPKQ